MNGFIMNGSSMNYTDKSFYNFKIPDLMQIKQHAYPLHGLLGDGLSKMFWFQKICHKRDRGIVSLFHKLLWHADLKPILVQMIGYKSSK